MKRAGIDPFVSNGFRIPKKVRRECAQNVVVESVRPREETSSQPRKAVPPNNGTGMSRRRETEAYRHSDNRQIENRPVESLREMEAIIDPEGEKIWRNELSNYPKKRQRLPQITQKEKFIVKRFLDHNAHPRGSVDVQHYADRLGIDYHKVRHQVRKVEPKKPPLQKRQMREKISDEQKDRLSRKIVNSEPIRGSVDVEHIRKNELPDLRRDQIENYRRRS